MPPEGIDIHWLVQPDPRVPIHRNKRISSAPLDWPDGRVQTPVALQENPASSAACGSFLPGINGKDNLPRRKDVYIWACLRFIGHKLGLCGRRSINKMKRKRKVEKYINADE